MITNSKEQTKLKKHKRVCNDYDCCYVSKSNEDRKILKYNHGEKSLKTSAIIYADLECLLENMHHINIILKNLIQTKKLSIHLLVTHCLQIAPLIQQKTNLISTKTNTVWKGLVST